MPGETPLVFWFAFNAVVLSLLALDLFLFHRNPHPVSGREAALWSAFWILLSLGLNVLIWKAMGPTLALEFLTGYLIEVSLSVDNIFVFVLIFGYFRVPAAYQHRVLFWGIVGALVMRGMMIWLGVTLIENFAWMFYVFGAFLVFTGIKMATSGGESVDPEHNPLVRLCCRLFPMSKTYAGGNFVVREGSRTMLTPLALVLVMVESTDLLFALDSIPAIVAITQHKFIIYTSNVCAILGLRALYFLLAAVVTKFVYLRFGLAAILTFIGIKMLIADFIHLPTEVALGAVAACLLLSVAASLLFPPGKEDVPRSPGTKGAEE